MLENHGSIVGRLINSIGAVIPAVFLFICVAVLGEVVYFTVISKKRKEHGMKAGLVYHLLRYVFYLYLMMVYIQTGMTGAIWTAQPINPDRIYLIPLTTSPDDIVPYLLNILMTVPLGFLLPLIWPSFRTLKKVALAGFLLSFGIEFMQLFSNRLTSTGDLIMNTLGAVIGYGIFYLMFKWITKGTDVLESKKMSSRVIANEAALNLILSFVGAVLLNHPGISMMLPQWGAHEEMNSVADDDEVAGQAIEILEDRIRVRIIDVMILPNGTTIPALDDGFMHDESISEDDLTDFLWASDLQVMIFSGTEANVDIQSGTVADINFGDLVNIVADMNDDDELMAIEIQVWRVGLIDE